MKKALLILTLIFTSVISALAQSDKIYKHSGELVEGSVVRVAEYTIVFKYANEDAEQTISKYAVEKIVYGKSGRTENVTARVLVVNKLDWERVVILEDKSQISGLIKAGDVRGKTSVFNFHTGNSGDKKAEKKLKEAAAEMGCPFVFITMEKSTNTANESGWGGNQDIKKGIAFKYL